MRQRSVMRSALYATFLIVGMLFIALIAHTADNAHRAGHDAIGSLISVEHSHAAPSMSNDQNAPFNSEHGEHLDLASGRALIAVAALITSTSVFVFFLQRRLLPAIARAVPTEHRALSIVQLSILRT